MAKHKEKDVALLRNGILAAVGIIVVGVIVYGTLYSTGATQSGAFVEGTHYVEVENPPRRRPTDPIVVTEFFSYGCIHCKNFDPLLDDWLPTLPEDVVFKRSPVAFSPAWAMLGQSYLALESVDALDANHRRIFRAIHDQGRQFASVDMIADFVDGRGVTKDEFMEAYNSTRVRRALATGDAHQRTFAIASVPTLVVADKYIINMDVGRRQALEVVDYLIALEQDERQPEASDGRETSP